MQRAIGGVVLGYVTMFVLVFATFSLLYLALGADRAFLPGTYDVSPLWGVSSVVLGLAAAFFGGRVCRAVAGGSRAPKVLAALVFALGIGTAMMTPAAPPVPPARTADVGNLEAMQYAATPSWAAWSNPFLGAAGVLLGGGALRRRALAPSVS